MITKNWVQRNWKWIIPSSFVFLCFIFFFLMTGNATWRYGTVYLQPDLIENARVIAGKNKQVQEKFGKLQPHNFLQLLEGEVVYAENNESITITVGLIGSKNRGKLDIKARKVNKNWEYDVIRVRIKKPERLTIVVLYTLSLKRCVFN